MDVQSTLLVERKRSRWESRPRVQITRVGLWFCVFTFVITVAASNTGNNALYMVVATMAGLLGLSIVAGFANLVGIEIGGLAIGECFAGEAVPLPLRLSNRSRWLPKWLIQICFLEADNSDSRQDSGHGALVSHLTRRRRGKLAWSEVAQELRFEDRGRQWLIGPTLSTLFPFGLFRISRQLGIQHGVVIFPRLIEGITAEVELAGSSGDETARRSGFGHDLYSLRQMRPGDDPRGIHWKQSARTGRLIYQQRAAEEGSRVSIIFDNGLPTGKLEEFKARFERAVSEAATLAIQYLAHDFEVELITRDEVIPYCGGELGRLQVLEVLALVEPIEGDFEPLLPNTQFSSVERRFEVGFCEEEIALPEKVSAAYRATTVPEGAPLR